MTNIFNRISIDIPRLHSRAIRDEIGERLRILMRRKPSQISLRLLSLMKQLAKADR
jgi:hypothetical protein